MQTNNIRTFDPQMTRLFQIFVAIHVFLWALVPALVRTNLSLDVVEGIMWGKEWQWGYYKHPFLAPWLSEIAFRLSPHSGWAVYLLSQLVIAIAFMAVWRLVLEFSTPLKALFSVFLLEGVIGSTYSTVEFNPNILLIGIWSLGYLWFYYALTKKRLLDWILLGFICGLSIVSKYYSGTLLITMLVFLVANRAARQSFRHYRLYVGLIVFLITISPNLYWLYRHDFSPLYYAVSRVSHVNHFFNHLIAPSSFLVQQLPFVVIALLMFFIVLVPRNTFANSFPNDFSKQLIHTLFWGPLVITLLYSAITANNLVTAWGTPLYSLLGVILVHSVTDNEFKTRIKPMQMITYSVMALLLAAYAIATIGQEFIQPNHPTRQYFPGKNVADQVTHIWRQQYHQPLRYVIGSTWLAGNISVYSPDRPSAVIWDGEELNLQQSSWIDPLDLKKTGAVVIWQQGPEPCKIPENYLKQYPNLNCYASIKIHHQMNHEIYPISLMVGIIPPA